MRHDDGGVYAYSSTAESNRSKSISDWDVWFWDGANLQTILPYHTSHGHRRIESLGSMDPLCSEYVDMQAYCLGQFPDTPWMHVWLRYNQQYLTLDRRFYSIDMYVQTAPMITSSMYVWYSPHPLQATGMSCIATTPPGHFHPSTRPRTWHTYHVRTTLSRTVRRGTFWYILMDCIERSQWFFSKIARMQGMRRFEFQDVSAGIVRSRL